MLLLLVQLQYHKESIRSVDLLRPLVPLMRLFHLLPPKQILLPLMVGIQPALVALRLLLVVPILLQIFKLVLLILMLIRNGPTLRLELSHYIHNGLINPLLYLLSLEPVAPVVGVHLLLPLLLLMLLAPRSLLQVILYYMAYAKLLLTYLIMQMEALALQHPKQLQIITLPHLSH